MTYCGTFDYMAPEVLKQEDQTEKTDVWCLGVLLYEMVVGEIPYASQDIKAKLEIIQDDPLVIPNHIPISDDLKSLIFLILTENPKKRPTMPNILSHPWIVKNAKKHNIDISKYLHLSTNENHAMSQLKDQSQKILITDHGEDDRKSERKSENSPPLTSPLKGNTKAFIQEIQEFKANNDQNEEGIKRSIKENFKEALKKLNENKNSIGSKKIFEDSKNIIRTEEFPTEGESKRDRETTSILVRGKNQTE